VSDELLRLAERVEAATGPDRELNIAMLPLVGIRFVDEGHPIGQVCYDSNGHGVPMPNFTASLDAAMTLVPEGWWKDLFDADDGDCLAAFWHEETDTEINVRGKTWPLALCAASLRSRAHPLEGE
jgi:hypothetical protein